jgi:hypothetical protein
MKNDLYQFKIQIVNAVMLRSCRFHSCKSTGFYEIRKEPGRNIYKSPAELTTR